MDQHTTGTRRTFVKFASAAIASAAVPIRVNDRINIGIVGLGGRGNDHIEYFTNLSSECRIAAICDVNQAARERAQAHIVKLGDAQAKEYNDMRDLFASKDIDAVALPLPNHWHALATIWACQAGKDVYVEKPASHNIFRRQQMVEAARKYNRMVQVGARAARSCTRSGDHGIARTRRDRTVYRPEAFASAGVSRSATHPMRPCPPVSTGVCFLGPAQWKPYSVNKYKYTWHWFWDTGNGDIGNQGVHERIFVCGVLAAAAGLFPFHRWAASMPGRTISRLRIPCKAAGTSATRRSASMCATCLRRLRGSAGARP